ncbi:acyltransferase [Acinetobacter bereziniae]|jgi:acetyltransferase-like isoleucine patch superfamily enzyme|uniref:acyltransferase n=1 Tax=Acinetobacter bereziniae TaxID=106648 RepID=UPI0021D199EB|nr:acyltransferase [Acinetobacter bereziniae]MCU4316006.1 acyltransferase [Acinetobacter bereziniae]
MKGFFLEFIYLIFRCFKKAYRISFVYIAKKNGLVIGKDSLLVGSQDFGSEPFLIEIGQKCLITDGVRFVTHDGSIQVPLIEKGASVESVYSHYSTFGKIILKDNVFVGVSAILLPNTEVGENSIIAAGAIVKGKFPKNCVLAGNPAKIICSIDDYYNKHCKKILELTNKTNRKEQILLFINNRRAQ